MSDPTYRIDVEHKPHEVGALKWIARVVRLSDGQSVTSRWGTSPEDAVQEAQAAIVAMNAQQPSFSLFVGDDGRPVEAHSVKAS